MIYDPIFYLLLEERNEAIKSRSNWDNAWYHSDRKLLSTLLLYKNITFKIYKPII